CDNLRALIAQYMAAHGRRPALWFVEDRLETLQHVTTHADLDDVGLFLAAWGYNTPAIQASVLDNGRIRLLELEQFQSGLTAWPEGIACTQVPYSVGDVPVELISFSLFRESQRVHEVDQLNGYTTQAIRSVSGAPPPTRVLASVVTR